MESNDSFPDEVVEDVDGLLWLGFLEDYVEFCGHDFVIRTLRLEEEMLAGLAAKDYEGSLSQTKALIAAQVGMALVSVDGDEAFCPAAGPNRKDYARARFNYVIKNWYEPTINHIYLSYLDLLRRQSKVLEEMENLSQESLTTFTASPDSSIPKADSHPPEAEIMEYLEDAPEDLIPFNEGS
jgi:hypothetical protein